jgi:hypothetical protein
MKILQKIILSQNNNLPFQKGESAVAAAAIIIIVVIRIKTHPFRNHPPFRMAASKYTNH